MRILRGFSFHTFFFAIFAVVSLYANNYGEINIQMLWRPLGLSVLLAALLWAFCFLIIKDGIKAGVFATDLLFFFFVYGHYKNFVESVLSSSSLIVTGLISVLWISIMIFGVMFLFKKVHSFQPIHQVLNVFTISTLIIPIFQIGFASARNSVHFFEREKTNDLVNAQLLTPTSNPLPDIYFIILDSYGRQDSLEELFGYDNQPFISRLEDEGFFVADCSLSNYTRTALSVTSTLNYEYIQNMGIEHDPDNEDRTEVWFLFKHNRVMQQLKELGYKTIAFETGYDWSSLQGSDLYFTPDDTSISSFESMLLESTILTIPIAAREKIIEIFHTGDYQWKYEEFITRQRFILETLENEVPTIPGPKFVFVHLMIPHPPYIFDPQGNFPSEKKIYENNGSPVNDDYYRIGYTNQIAFINDRMLEIVNKIKSGSDTQPIILIEGDHGTFETYEQGQPVRVPENFSAYYLPYGGASNLYPAISPVNSFRVIFNTYFGTDLPILEDASYPSQSKFYDFQTYEERFPGCKK